MWNFFPREVLHAGSLTLFLNNRRLARILSEIFVNMICESFLKFRLSPFFNGGRL